MVGVGEEIGHLDASSILRGVHESAGVSRWRRYKPVTRPDV
jgi:hypothetical protein